MTEDFTNSTDEEISQAVRAGCEEIERRWHDERHRSLELATALWPDLLVALRANGRCISTVSIGQGPIWPEWANQPVVSLHGYYGNKPRTKTAAMELALTVGTSDGGWVTLGELFLWIQGTGPIVWRSLHEFGFGGKLPKPPLGYVQ